MFIKPKIANIEDSEINPDHIGFLAAEYEPFEPNSKYDYTARALTMPKLASGWKIIRPKKGPPLGDLPRIMTKMFDITWKLTEPAAGAARGNVIMGARGAVVPDSVRKATYHPQVAPSKGIDVKFNSNQGAIATDWDNFKQIPRTNAVTFRGDKRTPREVINLYGGFDPASSRTDRFYLENNLYHGFNGYLQRRFQRQLSKADFLKAVDSSAPSPDDKKMLVDFLMWRQILKREEAHLGRMVSTECEKGYISTSRSMDSSINFAISGYKPGWLYIVIVHSGFIVPEEKKIWGSREGEIAQWGRIPKERIVGFRYYPTVYPKGPIFISRTFRKTEPEAAKYFYNVMSGKAPQSIE